MKKRPGLAHFLKKNDLIRLYILIERAIVVCKRDANEFLLT